MNGKIDECEWMNKCTTCIVKACQNVDGQLSGCSCFANQPGRLRRHRLFKVISMPMKPSLSLSHSSFVSFRSTVIARRLHSSSSLSFPFAFFLPLIFTIGQRTRAPASEQLDEARWESESKTHRERERERERERKILLLSSPPSTLHTNTPTPAFTAS